MRNPQSNLQPSSSIDLTRAKFRASFARMIALARKLKPLHISLMVALAGALLLAAMFLHPNPVKHSPANEVTLSAAVTPQTSAQLAQTQVQPKQNAKRAEKRLAPQLETANKKSETKSQSESQKFPAPGARPARELQLSPGAPPIKEGEGEPENGDEIRARGNWFHDQRAYPFAHIPSGALQEAIRQRDAMKQRQRAQSQFNPQAVITFPGDALWHLMGPQPVNELFSVNSGFPTASGRVTAIAVDPTDTLGKTVYIGGAAGGVWKTTDAGATWSVLTDTQPSLAVGSIAIDPNSCTPGPCQTIYVGTGEENFNGDAYYGAGILKSTDAGAHWTQMGASTFEQVLGTQTGGALIGQIAVQPGNPNIVLAAISFFVGGTVGGIYRSTDAGVNWTEVSGANAPIGVAATGVVFDPAGSATNTATVYAAMGNPFGETANGIYKSTDSGATWSKLTTGLPPSGANTGMGRITLAIAPSTTGSTAVLYAAIADAAHSSGPLLGLFKTSTGGSSWSQVSTAPNFCNSSIVPPLSGQCFYDMAVAVHPTNANFVVVGGGAFTNNSTSLFKTTDGGTTWSGSIAGTDFTLGTDSTRPHVDTHAFAFAANGAGFRLYVGNDGGMWRTDNPTPTPPTWVDLNATLAITQFYPGPSAGIGDENFGFGGTQDNDTELFSGNLAWDNVFACGDGGFTAIDPNIPTTVYTTCDRLAGAVVGKSVFNGSIATGQTFVEADTGIVRTDRAQFIPPLTIDQNNPNTLYFGTCRLYQTTDGANTWNPISGDLSNGNATPTTCPAVAGNPTITTMDVAHQSSNIILAGTSNGKVWETTTGGILWNEIDAGLPQRHVTAVRTKRSDATGQIAYVTLSGFGACGGCGATPGHVFKTINGGATWTNISGDLPDIPVNDLIVDHSGNPTFDALYIGTDVGVFSCPDPEAATPCTNWTVLGDGLPNSPVLGLAMRRSSRILRAATHGRSMWSIQLTDEAPPSIASLSSVTPGAVKVGAATLPVDIFGLNLSTSTQVFFDGAPVGAATFVDTTHLTISVNSSFFTNGIVYQVSITDPAGADTSTLPFTVMNPILNAVSMTPPSTTVGTPVTLHFTGSNFVNGTTVFLSTFPGLALPGGVASAGGTVFDVPIPSFLLTAPAAITVSVTNPLPGGGPNPPFTFPFTINPNPNPVAIFNPPGILLGPIPVGTNTSTTNFSIQNGGGATLSITAAALTGTNAANFVFVAATSAPSCNFETTGTASVAAGASCFFGIKFSANNPPGQANSIATLKVTDNSGGTAGTIQNISVTGLVGPVVFISPVNFGAVTINTTSPTMNSTVLSFGGGATVTAVGISGTNQADFKVVAAATGPGTNPDCGAAPILLVANTPCDIGLQFTPSIVGNETATISLTDNAIASPQSAQLSGVGVEVTSISPSIVPTGGPAFTLTVNGGGFAPSAVVNLNGSTRLTTFVSANQLQASIPASDITTAGNRAITVTTPFPGGITSEPKTLIVAQATVSTNDNINFAKVVRTDSIRTAFASYTGGFAGVNIAWSPAFPDTNYTAVCTVETSPGGDPLLPTIILRTPTSMTVIPTDGGSASGTLGCIAIPDSDSSDIRHAHVAFSGSPTTVAVNWSPVFPDTNYTTACTLETQGGIGGGFTSVISALTAASVSVDAGGFATGTMHCIAVPDSDASDVRHGRAAFAGTPATVSVSWNSALPDTNYAAVCSEVQPGVTVSDFAVVISAGSRTSGSLSVLNGISAGTVHCLAVPATPTTPTRISQDTTQATTDTGGFADPLPSCGSGSKARSVWFTFTPSVSGKVVADTRFSSYTTILSAWTGTAGSLAAVAGSCASGNVPATSTSPIQSLIGFNVTGGTKYFVMATDARTGPGAVGGTLTYSMDFQPTAPANDDNATPTVIASAPFTNSTNTIQATPNTNGHADPTLPGGCATGATSSGQANSVWYSFTAPSAGTITADTLTSPYDTILNVTSGSPAGTQVACNNDAAAGIAQSQVSFAATASTTYFFMVSSFLGDGGTTNFHLTFTVGAAGVPATITATSGTPQNVAINTAFGAPLVATVLDSFSTPVSGANVTFTAPGSGASGKFSNNTATITIATNASGVASAPFTANATAGGPYAVTATVPGVATPANFSLTNNAGAAASMTANAGTTPQSATINTAFANALAVTVKDAGSNPVSGVNVTFTAPGSGASGKFSNNTATIIVATNASGVASAPFTANGTVGGPYTVTAAATGLTTVNFSLTNTAGAASSMTANAGTTPQSATINTAFANALAVTVTDAGSNPISGVNVTFTAPGSGASGKFSNNTATITVATNASGVASAPFTANATVGGPYTVTAAATGLTTVNFSLTNNAGAAASMTANAGTTPQSATINTAFANALAVTVKDAGSNPVSGVNVTFTAPGSGASGKFSNNTATITVATNASGVASAPFTANATAGGPYTVTAAATGLTTVNFSLTNTAGAAASMTANAGTTPQSATINTAFANALAVTVTDAGSNPISGVNVTFTAPGSGASGKFSNNTATITVATNASGVASAPFTANGTAGGPYTVTAAATGLTTLNFSLTNNAGAAASMTANAGTTPQSATINTAFANALAVTVKDAGSNPVSGVNVTFTAPGSGASGKFSNNTATIIVATNASGVASAPFTANATAGGPYTVTAAATGLTTVNFSLTNTAGAASSMTANAGTTPQSAAINTAFANPLAVTVKDAGSNPVSGVNVTFTGPGSGASGKFSNNTATIIVATNASGVASAPFTANATAGGPYTVTAAATGLTTVNFSLTNTAGAASSMTANAGATPQSAAINTAFANPLAVTVTDAGSNPVAGVNVTFTTPGSGASGKFSNNTATITVATNASGVASAPFTANATAGGPYTVTAAATGVTTVNFSLTNLTGAAGSMTANAGTTPQSAAINTAFANPLAVTVKDAGSNPVSGVNVTFAAPGSGASGVFSNNTATITVATNASGVASAPFTANSTAGGPYSVTASATGLATVNFSLTNTAGAASSMTANAGTTPQSATINTAFANALAVTVKDAGSNPVSGVNVTFTAPGSGASGKFSNNTATISVATNASGVASAPFTANATAGGPYTVTAAATGLTTVNFSLTNTAGAASSMTANAGTTPQSATVNTAFANALAVTVKDASSNPISGVNVTFTAPGSGASGKFSNNTATITVATNASGVASAPFTANGTAGGPYTVTAAATGLTTVNFSLANNAGVAVLMSLNAGSTPQSTAVNTAFANPLAVTVTDGGSNPVSGVNVMFAAPGSGSSGKFSNNTATITVATNASGVASAPFTANGTAGGPYTVTAAATGLTTVNFSLTNLTGAAASMTANAGTTPQSAAVSTAFANALAVTVKDASSNPISGVNVTFTAPGSGASGVFSNSTATIIVATNASGVASAPFTANATAGGPYTVTAAAAGVATVNFSLTNTAGTPTSMTANAGTTPQSATINTAFANALAVTVKDAGSNPVSGVNVTFTAPGSAASGKFSNNTATINVATDASGVASAPFTANATVGGPYTVTAAAAGLTTVNFSLTNTAGPAAKLAFSVQPTNVAAGSSIAPAVQVTVQDAGGNTVTIATNSITLAIGTNPSGGTLSGTTSVAAVNGVATFANLSINKSGTGCTLAASATGLTGTTSSAFNVVAGAAAKLVFAVQPSNVLTGAAITPAVQVTVQDAFGNTVITAVNPVTMAIGTNPSAGSLSGTTTIAAVNGIAAFSTLSINKAGTGYTLTASAAGLTSATSTAFNVNNPVPTVTSLVPANVNAGSGILLLTIIGTNFATGATVTFGSDPTTLVPVTNNGTVITVNIPAADLATGGMFPVVVTNPGPGGGPSAVTANSTFIVNNPVPTVGNAAVAGKIHISGGAPFTLTVTGTNFVSNSVVNFNGNAVTTHFGTATQLTADIPASAVVKAGNVNVTVTNLAPAGGTSAPPFVFTVDGFTVGGPANTNVTDGKVAMIEIDVTPTVNGFTNPVTFSVTGLPKNTSFVFVPTSVTPNGAVGKTILQVTTKAGSVVPPSSPFERPPSPLLRFLPIVWIAALLAGIYAMLLLRRTPQIQVRRYAAIVPLALLLLTGAVLAGCAGQFTGTPKGAAPLVVTATSGTMSQTANVTLTVQ